MAAVKRTKGKKRPTVSQYGLPLRSLESLRQQYYLANYGADTRAGDERALVATAVLVDMLAEMGWVKMAQSLDQWVRQGRSLGYRNYQRSDSTVIQWPFQNKLYRALFGRSPNPHATRKKGSRVWVAQVAYGWVEPMAIAGNSGDGRPWILGIPSGNFSYTILVYARHEGDALEIAEERFPDRIGGPIDEEDLEDPDLEYDFLHPESEVPMRYDDGIRIEPTRHVEYARRLPDSDEAVLKSGHVVRYYT